MATVMMGLVSECWSRGQTITYCLSIRAICKIMLLIMIVDDAPGIARISVAAFQQSILGGIADFFERTDLGSFGVSPVGAGKLMDCHLCRTA
jgi:hypothetical protein